MLEILNKTISWFKNFNNLLFTILTSLLLIYIASISYFDTHQKKDLPKAQSLPKNQQSITLDPLASLKNQIEHPQKINPSKEELQKAAETLDFTNLAQELLTEGYLSQADLLAFFMHIYQGEWQLALLPENHTDLEELKKQMLPKDTLLGLETKNYLQEQVFKMVELTQEMLQNYEALGQYVQDESIQDEGVRGKELAKVILDKYVLFKQARQNYGELLDEEARVAEDIFLSQSPLRRQIMVSRSIFGLFQEVSWALAEKQSREVTRKLGQRLQNLLDYAKEPPFKDKPLKERAYREFLKKVQNYLEVLAQGNEEGFYPKNRKLLNDSLADCRSAYNRFAYLLNEE